MENLIIESRKKFKELNIQYRNLARTIDENITISDHAEVRMTEDGAFVEALVWVPKELIERDNCDTF